MTPAPSLLISCMTLVYRDRAEWIEPCCRPRTSGWLSARGDGGLSGQGWHLAKCYLEPLASASGLLHMTILYVMHQIRWHLNLNVSVRKGCEPDMPIISTGTGRGEADLNIPYSQGSIPPRVATVPLRCRSPLGEHGVTVALHNSSFGTLLRSSTKGLRERMRCGGERFDAQDEFSVMCGSKRAFGSAV